MFGGYCCKKDFNAGPGLCKVPQVRADDGDHICVFYAVEQVSDQNHQKSTTLMQYQAFGAKHQMPFWAIETVTF